MNSAEKNRKISQENQIIGDAFRAAMRRFPATVTVITSQAPDSKLDHGMTVTAVTSVSMDPPSLLVCLNNRTWLHEILMRRADFIVNVLGREHGAISDAFSGKTPPPDRFKTGDWRRHDSGIQMLGPAHANIVCRCAAAIPFGTHTIFIGEVVDTLIGETSDPLLYENARYTGLLPVAASA